MNLLVPSVTSRLRRSPVEWVDKLSAQLAAQGGELRIFPADACYTQRPGRALEKLIQRNPADCWLVRLSTLPLQQWLEAHGVPAVLVGTGHPGIGLPFIDIDHRTLSRHAVGVLLAAGHRRITLLADRDPKAGDLESQRGFAEATLLNPQHPNLRANVARFQGNVEGMIHQLDLLLRGPERPTALAVPHAIYCLTIWSYLGSRGVRIPADMSVIAHLGTPDLPYLTPEPAHYRLNPTTYVQRILRAVLARVSGGVVRREAPLLPEFVRGGSIAPPIR